MILGRIYKFADSSKKFPFDYERGFKVITNGEFYRRYYPDSMIVRDILNVKLCKGYLDWEPVND